MGIKYPGLLLILLLPVFISGASAAIYVENASAFDFSLNAAPVGLSSSLDGIQPRIFTEDVDSILGPSLTTPSMELNNSLSAVRPRIFTEDVDSLLGKKLLVAPVGLDSSLTAVRPRIFTEDIDTILRNNLVDTPSTIDSSLSQVRPRIFTEQIDSLWYPQIAPYIGTPTPLTAIIELPTNNYYSEEFVNFRGTASGGVPPYTYTWVSDKQGILSTTPTTTSTSDEFSKNLTMGTQRIDLNVRDSLGNVRTETVILNVVKQVMDVYVVPVNFASYNSGSEPDGDIQEIDIQKKEKGFADLYRDSSYGSVHVNFHPTLNKVTIKKQSDYKTTANKDIDPAIYWDAYYEMIKQGIPSPLSGVIFYLNIGPDYSKPNTETLGRDEYKFDWNSISGPAPVEGKLKELLQYYDIDWINTATAVKSSDGKEITVSNGVNHLSIRLSDTIWAKLEIDDGRTDVLKENIVNGEFNGELYKMVDYSTVHRDDNYAIWVHESGHWENQRHRNLYDLYPDNPEHGVVWWWDIMGLGPQVSAGNIPDVIYPVQYSSFNKLILGWLKPTEVFIGQEKMLTPLEMGKYGDSVYIFKSEIDDSISYIIEARDLPPDNKIASNYPGDDTLEDGVVIYKVEKFDLLGTMRPTDENKWVINNLQHGLHLFSKNDPTLFDSQTEYVDIPQFVKFDLTSVSTTPYYQPTVRVNSCNLLCELLSGVSMDSNSASKSGGGASFSDSNGTIPDLDLHAVTPGGLHIGMNYTSGLYEMQIPGGVSSGDLIGGEEWIFVPTGTEVRYYIDSHDVQKYLEENPDVDPVNATMNYSISFMEYGENPQRVELPDGNWTVTNRTVSEPQNYIIEPGVIKEIVHVPSANSPTPELSTAILTSAGLLGVLMISRRVRKN